MHRHCLKIAGGRIAAKHIQIGLSLVGAVDLRVTQNLRVGCGGNPVGIADVLIVLICGVINRSVPVPVDVDRTTQHEILHTGDKGRGRADHRRREHNADDRDDGSRPVFLQAL